MTRTLVITAAVIIIIFKPGYAQEQSQKNQIKTIVSDETVVITATRTEISVNNVASSITVITSQDIESSQKHFLLDVLRSTPSVDVIQSGGMGKTASVFMRGANPGHLLVLIDGVEAYDSSAPDRTFDFGTFPTENIERIEIVRGPQSTLYGSDAMAGVINIITKKGTGKPLISFLNEGGEKNYVTTT